MKAFLVKKHSNTVLVSINCDYLITRGSITQLVNCYAISANIELIKKNVPSISWLFVGVRKDLYDFALINKNQKFPEKRNLALNSSIQFDNSSEEFELIVTTADPINLGFKGLDDLKLITE